MDVEFDTDPGLGQVVAVVGALLALVATMLTWYTASVPIIGEVGSITGFGTDLGKLVAVLAIVAALSALLVAWEEGGAVLTTGLGLVGVLVLVFKFLDLADPVTVEVGFFAALAGCLIVLTGGALGLREKTAEPMDTLGA
ncbi:MAG: hypothetical protein ABEJ05_03340 [Haloglomus sp.]